MATAQSGPQRPERHRSRGRSFNRRGNSKSPARKRNQNTDYQDDSEPNGLRWFHATFGSQARNYRPNCTYSENE
ncbi:hypothetical protein JTE90_002904 [Oedothorax gibbosus]|uniref:Uncharacterized protein n=1 Tax=Oedothorax gibbosus TaxID=931172 RepID=A0AAV6UA43_9ARAC|nr:hypothetical protein JTE90_002904 [Oedothorax gibbosus]